jgi:reverse transcriptase-like protein/group II intron maturase/HNH endonuclease
MTTAQAVGAVSRDAAEWYGLDWQAINRNVRRLQVRIVQATKASRWGKVRALQRLLTHSYSGKVLAVRRVTENNGKKTPGVDNEIWDTPEKKTQAVHALKRRGYQPQPLRRVYIPKSDGRTMRPLGIPTMKDTFLGGIRKTIKAALGMSAADVIHELNPKIRGWANYHRHVVSKRTYVRVDHEIFSSLWRWARRRHPNKNTRWRKQKYFALHRGHDWSFFGETCDDEGQPSQVWLRHARSTPIKRHVKVKGDANPYDPAYETYFEQREGTHMQDTFRGTRTLRFLWHEQSGLCTVCNTKITRITGWRLHHCVPRVMGGSQSAENRVLLHPECHDRVHRQRIPVSKPRLPERGVRRA